jgi:hypothetical protein
MNEKSYVNEAMFVFAIQSCCWKILNFLTRARESDMVARSKVLGSKSHARPNKLSLVAIPNSSILGLVAMLDPRAWVLHQTWVLNPKRLSLTIMSNLRFLSLLTMWPNQTTNKERTIVHFNCQKREKKETNTNNQSPTTIQSWYVYMRRSMLKRAWLHI